MVCMVCNGGMVTLTYLGDIWGIFRGVGYGISGNLVPDSSAVSEKDLAQPPISNRERISGGLGFNSIWGAKRKVPSSVPPWLAKTGVDRISSRDVWKSSYRGSRVWYGTGYVPKHCDAIVVDQTNNLD